VVSPALFTSAKGDWTTPPDLFKELDALYHFKLDVAASDENALCECYFVEGDRTFEEDWSKFDGAVWCNPPYGRGVGKWVDKCIATAEAGATTVLLVPARPDTKWFYRAFTKAACVFFVRGRLKFGGGKTPAPFPSVIFVFKPPALHTYANPFVEFYSPGALSVPAPAAHQSPPQAGVPAVSV
jgi:site-specific DNA-methyltransferase (adenine-specific)